MPAASLHRLSKAVTGCRDSLFRVMRFRPNLCVRARLIRLSRRACAGNWGPLVAGRLQTDTGHAASAAHRHTESTHESGLRFREGEGDIGGEAERLAARQRVQYHIHLTLALPGGDWDVAINVGTNDADDLLNYKLVYDFHHRSRRRSRPRPRLTDLTEAALPARLPAQRHP